MKIYVINLERRPDRLAYMKDILGDRGLSFELVQAVDGTDPAIAAQAGALPTNATGQSLSTFAFACLLSHRKAWQRFLDSGEAHALILEDDVVPAQNLVWLTGDTWFPADGDIVKLETFATRVHTSRKSMPAPENRNLRLLKSDHPGSAAYVLTRRAAELLMDINEKVMDPADEIMFRPELGYLPDLRIYQMSPAPFIQMDRSSKSQPGWARSDIILRSGNDQLDAKRPETRSQRLLRRLTNEVSAALRGTRYVVVPHG